MKQVNFRFDPAMQLAEALLYSIFYLITTAVAESFQNACMNDISPKFDVMKILHEDIFVEGCT